MGSTASRLEPLRGGSLLLTLSSQNSWYSFYRPRKDETLSRPSSHPFVLNTGPLGWKASALTTRPLITAGLFKLKIIPNYCSRSVSIRFLEPIDSYPIRLTSLSESERFQPLSVAKIMPKKIGSNGNRRPLRYENLKHPI